MINTATSIHDLRIVSSYKLSRQKLFIKETSKISFVDFDTIVYCQAKSNYTNVILDSGVAILTSECLKSIISRISKPNFFRIHASYYINLDKVISLDKSLHTIRLGDIHLPIARSRYDSLLDYLK